MVDYRADFAFGQVIDNFDNGARELVPIPNSTNIVYKNAYESEAFYTNYNPRTIEFRTVTFDTHNTSVSPDVSQDGYNLRARKGTDVQFSVSSEDGFKLKDVMMEQELKDGSISTKLLKPISGDDYNRNYVIEHLDDNVKIIAHAEDFAASAPEGSGTVLDPYLISSKSELY